MTAAGTATARYAIDFVQLSRMLAGRFDSIMVGTQCGRMIEDSRQRLLKLGLIEPKNGILVVT